MHKYNYLFSCQKCAKGFMKEDHFKVYINRHNQMRPLQCDNCGKKFNRKNEAKRHLINTCQHTSESEIACPIYFKILKNVDCLRNHRNCVHKEENRFKCPYCQKFSFHKSTILWHVKSKHADMLYNVCKCTNSIYFHYSTRSVSSQLAQTYLIWKVI